MSYKPSKKTFGKYVHSALKNMLTLLKSDELPCARIFVPFTLLCSILCLNLWRLLIEHFYHKDEHLLCFA